MHYRRTTTGLLTAAVLLLAACGDDGDSEGDTATEGSRGTLTIQDLSFSAVTVAPGETITVDNRDDVPHTVTAQDGAFDTGNVDGGTTTTFVAPETPGDHAIQCEIHPQMAGTVTVASGEAPADNPDGESDSDDSY